MQISLTNPYTRRTTSYSAEQLEASESLCDALNMRAQYGLIGPRGASMLLQVFRDGTGRTIDMKARTVNYQPGDIGF